MSSRRPARGFTLVEVIVALSILAGVLIGLSDFTRRLTLSTRAASATTAASDAASVRLEEVKAWRVYATVVGTFHNTTETFTAGAWAGLTRQTRAVRTGPTATDDFVTVTVLVTGRGLAAPVRKTTIIARF